MQLDDVELGMISQCPASPLLARADELVQTYNSLNQSPCKVAAYLQSTCFGGSECSLACMSTALSPFAAFTVDPLPPGYQYAGPYVLDGDDLCKCNTVTYSLLSACGACQEDLWTGYVLIMLFYTPVYESESVVSWSEWAANCTRVLPPST